MLPLKQFQSWADCWWLISSSVISVCMLSPAVPSDVCVVLALLSGPGGVVIILQQCPVMCVSCTGFAFRPWRCLSSSYSSAQWCVCCTGFAFRPWRCLSSSYSSATGRVRTGGNECLAWSQTPSCQHLWTNRWEMNVSHGHRCDHASTCGPTGEKRMSSMVTDTIMPALVDPQVRNECLAWSQMQSCQHLWTNRWEMNVSHGHRCHYAGTCGPTVEKHATLNGTYAVVNSREESVCSK